MTSSCLPLQAVVSSIHNAASGADKWHHPNDQAPYFLYEKDSGNTIVEYKEGQQDEVFNDQTTASLWKQIQQFTDLDNDVLLAIIAHLIKCPEKDGSTWFFASNFLDYRGVKPIMKHDTPSGHARRAGHRQKDIADVGKSVDRIGNIWMTINQVIEEETAGATSRRKRRKRKAYSHRGHCPHDDAHGVFMRFPRYSYASEDDVQPVVEGTMRHLPQQPYFVHVPITCPATQDSRW